MNITELPVEVEWKTTPPEGVSKSEHIHTLMGVLIEAHNRVWVRTQHAPDTLFISEDVRYWVERLVFDRPHLFVKPDEEKAAQLDDASKGISSFYGTLRGRWKVYILRYLKEGIFVVADFRRGVSPMLFLRGEEVANLDCFCAGRVVENET